MSIETPTSRFSLGMPSIVRSRAFTGVAVIAIGSLLAIACGTTKSESNGTFSEELATMTTLGDPGPGPMTIDSSLRLDPVVARGLNSPTVVTNRPMRNQLWIGEKAGRVRVVTIETDWDLPEGRVKRSGYKLETGTVLDISNLVGTEGERGLLGLAFSTDARTLFVAYTDKRGDVVIASYVVTDTPLVPPTTTTTLRRSTSTIPATTTTTTTLNPSDSTTTIDPPRGELGITAIDTSSRIVLLTIPHADNTNHNGGQLAIGPDGYLSIGVGDGGGSGDPQGNAQDSESLLGKILRIDPGQNSIIAPYNIPPTNPYVDGGGSPEVWILGVRNPWRFSFDRSNGDLWIADPGESSFEEINRLPRSTGRGANLGWNWFEGSKRFAKDGTPPDDLVAPIHTYPNSDGACSVIGGYVYRGSAIPSLQGTYIFGDYCTGEVSGLLSRRGVLLDTKALGPKVDQNSLVSFGQDDQGELYVLSSSGSLFRLVSAR
jgi:glucose/arabinose dehydrogenase